MKFKVTVEGEYEVPDEKVMAIYGTTDPVECAEIDARNPMQDLLAVCGEDMEVTVQAWATPKPCSPTNKHTLVCRCDGRAWLPGGRKCDCPDCMNPPCEGFRWIGQDLAHCERCGRDISLHKGLSWGNVKDPFSAGEERIVPFDEARKGIPMFAHYVTPIDVPEDYAGPYRYDRADGWVTE